MFLEVIAGKITIEELFSCFPIFHNFTVMVLSLQCSWKMPLHKKIVPSGSLPVFGVVRLLSAVIKAPFTHYSFFGIVA